MDKKITQLGNLLSGILLLFLEECQFYSLEQLVQLSKEMGIPSGKLYCTGDIIGYCAQTEETIQLFSQLGSKGVLWAM